MTASTTPHASTKGSRSTGQGRRQGAQVDFGLARAGDAVQEYGLRRIWLGFIIGGGQDAVQRIPDRLLVGGELGRVERDELFAGQRVAPDFGLAQVHQAHLGQVF